LVSLFFFHSHRPHRPLHSFPTRRSSDLALNQHAAKAWITFGRLKAARQSGKKTLQHLFLLHANHAVKRAAHAYISLVSSAVGQRSEEHTSELQSPYDLVCRLLLEKKKKK